jgi:hypothetical protein
MTKDAFLSQNVITVVKIYVQRDTCKNVRGKGKVTPKQAYVALRGPGG